MIRLVTIILLGAMAVSLTAGPSTSGAVTASLQKKVDSLFVIASTGEIRYKDMVQPAKDSLIALGADAVPILIDKLDTKSAGERVALIDIFKKIGKPAVPDLLKALKRDNGLVVERVCNALGEIADSSAVPGLIAVADRHRWQVREQSVGSLGRCRSQRGDSVVAAALVDTIGQVRKAAAVSAGQLSLNGSIPALVHMLADDFYGARMCALETLLGLDTANVIHVIRDSLVSSNMQVGDRGCMVLGRLHNERARDLLMIETKSENPNRRAHAGVALITSDPLDSCGLQKQFVEPETDPLVKLKLLSAVAAGKMSAK
jgi:HEAT repeat protein